MLYLVRKSKNKQMNFTTVLFDMDGVIVDSLPTHALAAQSVLRKYGHNLTTEDYMQNFAGCTDTAGFRDFFGRLGQPVEVDVDPLVEEKAAEYLALCQGELVAFPGALEFIHELAGREVALGLVTSALRTEAELTLDSFDIRNKFGALVTAGDVGHSKPHPEPYLTGAAKLGAKPENCIVVEDSTDGVEAALRAGMRCLAVTNTCTAADLYEATMAVGQLGPDIAVALFPRQLTHLGVR
jgi:HAD superfamily hydrolase (TIGR01509 family)